MTTTALRPGAALAPAPRTVAGPVRAAGPALPPPRPDPEPPAGTWHLVERAQGGDQDAWTALWTAYHDTVQIFIYRRVGNHALAEDLAGEVWVRALRRLNTVAWQGVDVGAWLITVARNLVVDYFKSGRYRYEVPTEDMADHDTCDGSADRAVLEAATNAVLAAAILDNLTDDQRRCIVLRYLEGLSVRETAAVMGRDEGAVKALQYRAVRALGRVPAVQALRGLT